MNQYRYLSAAARERIAEAPKGALKQLSIELNLNYNTLRARRSGLKRSPATISPVSSSNRENTKMSDISFPAANMITACEALTLEDPNVLIIGDIHAPFHSTETLSRAVRITKKHFPHIKHCMIIGDLLDFASISSHLNNAPTTSAETDIRAGGLIIKELRKHFEVWIGPGNHDERGSKKFNSEFSMESLLCGAIGNSDPGLHLTDLDYFYIGTDIVAGHPSMYSSKPARVASKIALLQMKNVITGHSHKVGITMADNGINWAIDNGHCASEELFYYAKRRLNTFGKLSAGFTIISNNKPYVFGEMITDWEFWN